MGEALPMFMPTFNRSLVIEARPERLSSDGGAVLLREVLERSGIIPWMVARLADPRAQDQVTYRLEELLRTVLVLFGQGWRDQRGGRLGRDSVSPSISGSPAGWFPGVPLRVVA